MDTGCVISYIKLFNPFLSLQLSSRVQNHQDEFVHLTEWHSLDYYLLWVLRKASP